ncbi:MAG: ornithine cyclodeaminase family protein [Legionella sp.]|nr:MAG: ornithine cyclodeaminase family protein [Legionella sp.]
MSLLVLSQKEIKESITMPQAIQVMELAFKEFYAKKAIMPLRTPLSIENEKALMLTMPAYLSESLALGLKVVSIFPNNKTQNLPVINGVILLLNEQTGEAQALMEASYLTALRTGAVSGLATQYLAPATAKHVAIIGAGAQALTQFQAIAAVRPIQTVSLWSRDIRNAQEFAKQIVGDYEVHCFATVAEAVRNADVICTATASTEPLIQLADLKEGAHINAVGAHTHAMCEISNEVMSNALIVVDQLEAALAESGEVYAALQAQCIQQKDIIELGSLMGRELKTPTQRFSVFKSVGLAIQDMSIAHAVYKNALEKNLGTYLALS